MGGLYRRFKDFIFWERFKLGNTESAKEKILEHWRKEGQKVPPPHEYKQQVIKEFKIKYAIDTLVETGTFRGEMVYAQRNNFNKIYSIELSRPLYETTRKRLNKYNNVKLFCGDSKDVLPEVIEELKAPAVFWLDGHYSGFETAKGSQETPVRNELDIILKSPLEHIVLIDDARMFNGQNDYPVIGEIESRISGAKNNYSVKVEHDIIRIFPVKL